jgi:hypothetical protein
MAADSAFASLISLGDIVRGNPPLHRVIVVTNKAAGAQPAVTLTDCPLTAQVDPEHVYNIASGQMVPDVPDPSGSEPRPWNENSDTLQIKTGQWIVGTFTSDGKTCQR